MSYIDKHLLPDEQVTYRTRLHWILFAQPIAWILGWLLIGIFCGAQLSRALPVFYPFAQIMIYAGILHLLIQIIQYYTSEFGITTKRIVIKVGFIRIYSMETMLSRVESIQVVQSIMGRLLGYGSILICGTGGSKEIFHQIKEPLLFRQKVQERLSQ